MAGFPEHHAVQRLLTLAFALIPSALVHGSTNFAPLRIEVRHVAAGPAGAALEWDAPPADGWRVRVESRDALGAGAWGIAPGGDALATNRYTDPRPATAGRFYRLVPVAPEVARGRVVAAELLRAYSVFELQFIFQLAGVPLAPQSAVVLHRLTYETVSPWGGRTLATGALAVPAAAAQPLPLVSYQHGTVLLRSDLPSEQGTEALVGVVFAATGYAAAMPDYLGLADAPARHPYHHAKTHATATVDLLRAARQWSATNAVPLDGKVFLAGYSQGGHATVAAQREIESLHADEFNLVAVGAGAGAYDLAGITAEVFISDAPHPNPYYLPYLLLGFAEAYRDDAAALRDMLAPPWRATVPPLFNGLHDAGPINAALPAVPAAALDPAQLAAFRADPDHFLRRLLEENSLLEGWAPRAPLRLFHCAGDRDVPPANSARARDAYVAAGAAGVQLLDPLPTADHRACAQPTLLAVKLWFDSLR